MSQYINLNSLNPAATSGRDSKQIYMQRKRKRHIFSPLLVFVKRDDDTADVFFPPLTVVDISIYPQADEKTHTLQIFINCSWCAVKAQWGNAPAL